MITFPLFNTQHYLLVLRVVLGLFMMAHGVARLYYGSVDEFGAFLNDNGFQVGFLLANAITAFDIGGGAMLSLGFLRKPICTIFIFILIMGIILVHFPNGWFTVGHQSGGIEYSVLLILCFLLAASSPAKSLDGQERVSKRRRNKSVSNPLQ